MTLGETSRQPLTFFKSTAYVAERVPGNSIWTLLAREGERLFPDEMFADLFAARGRRSVPPRVVATVMVLQRLHGLSDREAVAAFEWDARWKFACGGLDYDAPGFVHTVLVSMRARLARSERPGASSRPRSRWRARRSCSLLSVCWTPRRSTTPSPRRTR